MTTPTGLSASEIEQLVRDYVAESLRRDDAIRSVLKGWEDTAAHMDRIGQSFDYAVSMRRCAKELRKVLSYG